MKRTVIIESGNDSTSPASVGSLPSDAGITPIQQPTELGEVLDKVNADVFKKNENVSSIDFNARIPNISFPFIVALDSLAQMKVLPRGSTSLTRAFKRDSVSLQGEGRKEVVKIVAGRREDEERRQSFGGQLVDRFKGLFGVGK